MTLIDQRTSERLIDDKHPWRCITDFQIEEWGKRRIRRVHVEWWEKNPDTKEHFTSWETLTDWMKGIKQRKELINCLSTNCKETEWMELIGRCNWEKLKCLLHESDSERESNVGESSSQSNDQFPVKKTATGVSPAKNKKPTGRKGDRFLLGGTKRTRKRRRHDLRIS